MLEIGKPTISKACASSACVEVTLLDAQEVRIRDTKEGGESLRLSLGDWRSFLRVYAQ